MKIEYLILNLLILIGPLVLSFDKKVHYYQYWPKVLISLGIVMIPFIIWDSAVSGIHWYFNEDYTLPVRILGLPIGEWLFFISVPFSCLFIWQIIVTDHKIKLVNYNNLLYFIILTAVIVSSLLMFMGKTYSALVWLSIAVTLILDKVLKTHLLFQKQTLTYLAIITGLICIFNGYLTARPVVQYNCEYYSNIRIWTIPIEDFGYGYSLILLCTILFEKLKGLSND